MQIYVLLTAFWAATLLWCPATWAAPYGLPPANKTSFCNYGVHLEWSARVGSSVFATPRVVDLMHDGRKEILIPTFSHLFEALSGLNGADVPNFPFMHPRFKTHASPLPVDMDGDGRTEWLIAMYTGELMVFTQEGKAVGMVRVPPLAVKKHWMEFVNSTLADTVGQKVPRLEVQGRRTFEEIIRARRLDDLTAFGTAQARPRANFSKGSGPDSSTHHFRGPHRYQPRFTKPTRKVEDDVAKDFEREVEFVKESIAADVEDTARIGPYGRLSPEARASMGLLFHPELYQAKATYEAEEDAFSAHHLIGRLSVEVAEDEIAVDAHILSTPVVIDVDKNGDLDVVVHVSYFFDALEHEEDMQKRLPEDVDPDDYAATAVICINMVTGEPKWIHVLELTSKKSESPAYAFSSPLIINADEDAALEIFLTSSTGRIVGLSAEGKLLPGEWPVTGLGFITASPAAEDVAGKGELGICTGNAEGKVTCFTPRGDVIWQRNIIGGLADRVSFGDINGDGFIDVVFGTTAGLIYAMDGRDGHVLTNFPVITKGPIMSPVLLMNVGRDAAHRGLHVVVPSHDGSLYIIDAVSGCIDSFDLDEKSSSMVLADDVTGNGYMDLVVTTIKGGVYVFETESLYHPAKAWDSKTKGTNGHTASENYVSISIDPEYRVPRDIRGDRFKLKFTIEDHRNAVKKRQYMVSAYVGPRVRVYHGIFQKPKTYTIEARAPLERMYSSLTLVLSLPNGQVLTDTISLSFNIHFLEAIKFVLVIPFLVTAVALLFVRKQHEVEPDTEEIIF